MQELLSARQIQLVGLNMLKYFDALGTKAVKTQPNQKINHIKGFPEIASAYRPLPSHILFIIA